MAQVLGGRYVAVPAPAYPVYERGAAFAGKEVLELPLREDAGFLPDLGAIPARTWSEVGLLWLNYPNNPTAVTAPLALYEEAAALAREHGFVLGSDEAYSEIFFGAEPPVSALQLEDLTGVAVFNTLSKRSSMPGYRSGFVAGDPELIGLLKRYRPERRRGAAVLHPARRDGRVARRGARRGGPRGLPAQARRAAAGARGARPAQRGRRRDLLPLARRRPAGRAARRPAARRGDRARAGLVLRALRDRLPPARRWCRASPAASAPPSGSTTCCARRRRERRGRAARAGSRPPGSR